MKSILLIISMLGSQSPSMLPESKISLSQLVDFEGLSNKPLLMNAARLTNYQENELHKKVMDWSLDRTDIHRLHQTFTFRSHKKLFDFEQAVREITESNLSYNVNIFIFEKKIVIELYTPEVMGLTQNDFILAARISMLKYLHFLNA